MSELGGYDPNHDFSLIILVSLKPQAIYLLDSSLHVVLVLSGHNQALASSHNVLRPIPVRIHLRLDSLKRTAITYHTDDRHTNKE